MGAPRGSVPRRAVAHVLGGQLAQLAVDEVDLGERDHAAPQPEQLADVEVLARLRHHALVGGDDEQHRSMPVAPATIVLHEALVAGHVDDAEPARPIGQVERREAELDGDAARLLLRQPVGVDAGERPHQRRLAVVDVAGGADDQTARDASAHAAGILPAGGCPSG